MTSRNAFEKNTLRLLLVPALAVGLAVGCSPAKGGGGSSGGSTGNSSSQSNGGSSSSSSSSSSGGSSGGSKSSSSSSSSGGSSGGSSSSGGSAGGSNSSSSGSGAGGSAGGSSSSGSGSEAGSTGSTGANPPGWYMTKDWNVTSADWHGCVWTGIDSTVTGTTTSIAPKDFTAATKEGGPYNVKGTVFNDYNSVAILGFDLNDTPKGSDQCSNAKRDPKAPGPPEVAFPSGATGIAFNWAQNSSTRVRIQIQQADGATNAKHQWCYNITDASGKSFAPFAKFNTKCWGSETDPNNPIGTYYTADGSPKISSIMFMIAGDKNKLSPYDFTINGFAPGTSADQAPGDATGSCGKQTGTIGSTTASKEASMMRAKVSGADCKQYIVQNNNWGNATGSTQTIDFVGNSFKVITSTGSGSGAPASFPSLFIGQNGDTAAGTYLTTDSGLPKQLSAMTSAQSTLKWGGKSSGNFNTTYDIWFSKTSTLPATYNDGISGLLMIWLYKPSGQQPIGSVKRQATIGGGSYDVWVGPRGTQSSGTDESGRPVVSYVAKSTMSSFSGDLKAFFDDAVKNGDADKSAGGTSQAFSNSWYLTDVFGGFEIWSGGDGVGLQVTEFSAVIK